MKKAASKGVKRCIYVISSRIGSVVVVLECPMGGLHSKSISLTLIQINHEEETNRLN